MNKRIIILLFLFILGSLFSCKIENKKHTKIELNKQQNKKELSLCQILDSLGDEISSIPYNTYRGTPYLKIKKTIKNKITQYRFYEEYPKYDEFGMVNGGKITLSRLLLFNKPINDITIMSLNDTIKISKNYKFKSIYNKYYIVDINDFFNEDPFYSDKIDFTIQLGNEYKEKKPILIGVYWDNLSDDYKKMKCK